MAIEVSAFISGMNCRDSVFLFHCPSDGDAASFGVPSWADIFTNDFYKKLGAVDVVCE